MLGFFPFVPFYPFFAHKLLGNTKNWVLKKNKREWPSSGEDAFGCTSLIWEFSLRGRDTVRTGQVKDRLGHL